MKTSNITNKVVVITGASSGIGESTAKLLAEQGAKVVLGARRSNRIDAIKVDEWDRQIDVNIKGLLYGVAAALPHMQKQKSGHIINIASVFGIKMFAPGGVVYCSTKAAVRALTEGLRMELHSQNIRCTMISL